MGRLLLGLLLALCAGLPARAEEGFPNRPIRLIVVFAPGGGADTTARLIAGPMSETLGRPVVVENRPGGVYGGQIAAAARPDGYTLMADASAFAVRHKLHANLSFDYVRDFAPVARLSIMPLLLVVPIDGPADLRELIAGLRGRRDVPGYSVAGIGSASHFAGLNFVLRAGIDAQSIAYRGGAPGAMAVLTGETSFNFATMPSAVGLVQGNRLRAVAVSSEARSSLLPNVPTVAEAALPGFALSEWIGLYAPTGTPVPIKERITAAVQQALAQPDVIARLAQQGAEPAYLGLEGFANFLAQQRQLLSELADRAGMRAE
jgi:tripartite-type tricarboxylate transporter receptor subunit TctC